MWKIFSSTAYAKNLIKFRTTTNRTNIAFSVNRPLIIGNVPGARRSDDPNPEWGVVTAVATRAQARSGKDPKPLKMKEMTDKMSINKNDLIKMQEEDPTLQKLKQLKGTEIRKGYVISYEKRGGIWYRMRQRKDDVGDPVSRSWFRNLKEKE